MQCWGLYLRHQLSYILSPSFFFSLNTHTRTWMHTHISSACCGSQFKTYWFRGTLGCKYKTITGILFEITEKWENGYGQGKALCLTTEHNWIRLLGGRKNTFKFSLEGTAWQRIVYTECVLNEQRILYTQCVLYKQRITCPPLNLKRDNVSRPRGTKGKCMGEDYRSVGYNHFMPCRRY